MRVLVASSRSEDMASLYGWLCADRDLARSGRVTGTPSSDPTVMGALEVIDVVLTHVTGLASLAIAASAWARTRRSTVTVTRSDGQTLTIDGASDVTSDIITEFLSSTGEPAAASPPSA